MNNRPRPRRSFDYGSDPALAAAARLVENLADLMPAVRAHARAELALVDGQPSKMPGSVEPSTTTRSRAITGKCSAPVPLPCTELVVLGADLSGEPVELPCGRQRPCPLHDKPGDLEALELVDCGRQRPCPEHDTQVDLTPVERAVEERLRIERWLADVEQQCQTIAIMAKAALDSGRRLVGTRLQVEARPSQCRDGHLGKDGTIEWGDPLCQAPSEKSGLCSKHYMAWYRWKKANRLDTAGMFPEPAVTGGDQGRTTSV